MTERKPFVGPIDYESLRLQLAQQQGFAQPPAIIAPEVVPEEEDTLALTPKVHPDIAAAFPYEQPPEEEGQGAISRFVEQAGVGFVETAGTATKAVEWAQNTLIGDDDAINEWAQRSGVIQEFNDNIDEWVTERTPEDIGLSDQIARGLGGIPLFFVPAMGVGKVAEIAKVAPKIANWFRIGTMAVLDSASAAGGIYSEELKKTGDADRASEVASKVFLANLPVSVALDKFGIFGDVRGTGMKGVAERAARSAGAGAVGGGIMAPTIAAIRDEEITGQQILESAVVGGVVAATMGVGVQLLSGYKGKANDFSGDNPEVDQLVADSHTEKAQKATDAQAQHIISPDSLVELSNLNRKLAREEVGEATDTPDFKLKTEDELIADLIETGESNDKVNDIILDKILAYYDYKQSKVTERAARKDTQQMVIEGDADLLTSDLSPAEKSAGTIEAILARQDSMEEAGLMAEERVRKSPEGRDRLKEQLQMDEVGPDVAERILYSYDLKMKKQETPITTTADDILLIEDNRKAAIEITNKSVDDFKQSLPDDQIALTAVVDEVTSRYNNSPLAVKADALAKMVDADPATVQTVQEALDKSSVGVKLKEVKKQQVTIEKDLKKIGKRIQAKEKPIVTKEETPAAKAKRLKKEKKTDNVMKLRERRTFILKERQALADKIYQSEIALKDTHPEHLAMLDKVDVLDSELTQISFKLDERVSTELKDITQIIPDFLKIAKDVTADPTIVTDKLMLVGKAIYKSGMSFSEFIKDMRFALGKVYNRFKDSMMDIYEIAKRKLASERGSIKLVKKTSIEPDTTPDDAAMIIKEADEVNTRLEEGDIRKDATPAVRLDGGVIKEGDSYKDIGNYQAEAGLQELGYVTKSGTFIPASDFAGGAIVPNEVIKVTGQPKTTLVDAVEKMRSPAIERAGEGKVINSADSAITIGDLKATVKKMKKKAKSKKISLEDYLRDLGLSERAVGEFVDIDAMHVRGANVIKKMVQAQADAFEKFEVNEGISIEKVMKDLDITKPKEGQKLSYKDAGKIMAYIQNDLGVKSGDIIELEVVLQSIQDGTRYVDKRNEGIKAAHFVRDLLLSPKQVLSRTTVGTKLYRIFDRSQVFKERDLEYMMGDTGLNLDKSLHLLKPGSESNKKIAEVLDGLKKAEGYLTTEENDAVRRIRSAFDYMADRFVKLKTRNAEEERLVRQLADTVKVKKGEKTGDVKKQLSKYKKEFNISKGGMESIDMLRMKIDDYLPHLFDRGDLIKTAAGRLQDVIAKEGEGSKQIPHLQDMIARLEGGEFIMHTEIPRDLYFAHLEKRRGAEGYQLDAGLALEAYTRSWAKKVYVEPAVNAAKDLFIKLPAEQKSYAKWFIMEQAGKNKRHPGAAIISQMEWIRTLGFSLGSALGNATGIVNTLTEGGLKPHAWEGFKRAASKEGIEEFYATGLARSIPQITAIDEVPHVLEKIRTVTGIFFNTVERGLRNHAYHTGKAQGTAMGLTGDDLVWHSIDFVNKTQHRYGVVGMAKGMRGWGGVVTQFSSYPIKQAELINSWMRGPDGNVNARGVQKVLAYMAMSAGINVTMKELLATDVSNFLGVGISYGELMETAMALSEADWLEAEKHWKLTTQGGHGILPSSIVPFGPFMGLIGELHDMRSPQYLSRVGGELTPVMANKFVDFYYALRDGDAKTNKFPVYAYEAKDMIGKITSGPKDLKYTLGLKETILRAFGPRPAAETALQAREYARFVTDDQIRKIVKQFDKALHKGDSKAIERLFRLYPGIVFDRGTGGAKRVEEKLTRTREERDARRLKQQTRRASLGFEL